MPKTLFITELLKELKLLYVELIDDAVEFFLEYEALYGIYAKESSRLVEVKRQLDTIITYKQQHGVFPQIKDSEDTETYIEELYTIKEKAEKELRDLEPQVFAGFERRRAMLRKVSKLVASGLTREKDANQFLTTMMLRAPMPTDHTRSINNEKNKPLYIAALTVSFLKRLVRRSMVECDFINERIPSMVPSEDNPNQKIPDPDMLQTFNNDVVLPFIEAALIHSLGSYSVEADRIFAGNRYRLLEEEDRKRLIRIMHDSTLNYLYYGLGKPREAEFSKNEQDNYKLELDKFELIETLVNNYTSSKDPIGNILRIPMIYSSFMLSTKPQHNYDIIYKAFDILQGGIEKGVIHKEYTEEFLRLVGRFPLGSGIFFNCVETHFPERAVVIGLNPPKTTSAIVKQLTKRQVQFDDHTQVAVSKEYNLVYESARTHSDFGPDYYEKQFPHGYYWNPAEPWERDIDHVKFWRRDNKIKEN